jgi:hypothetical protein
MKRTLLRSIQWTATAVVILLVLTISPVHSTQQVANPIAKEGLLRSLGKKVLSSNTLIRQVEQRGVTFQLSTEEELEIRRAGKYLGKKGLDDLIATVRHNYRVDAGTPPTIPPPLQPSNDFPISFLRDLPFKGGSPQKLDALMRAAGYTGPTAMAALIVANSDTSENEIIVGTRPDLNAKNSQPLMGGDSFNFPGGENTTRVYVLSTKDGKLDVTYRPRSVAPTKPSWDQIDGWARSLYPEGTRIASVQRVDDAQCDNGCQKCIVVLEDSGNRSKNESVTITYEFANGRWEWKAKKEN